MVADELSLGEICTQQTLLHRVLEIVLSRQMDDPVAIEGRAAAGDVEPEVQALGGGNIGQLPLGGARLLERHSVLLSQPCGSVALALMRSGRVQLEAAPRHAHVVAVLEPCERGFEAALAHVTPRAGDVRPDLDFHTARS